jgi:hypothetical protein
MGSKIVAPKKMGIARFTWNINGHFLLNPGEILVN